MIAAYKLLRVRRDGTLGSLFIDRGRILTPHHWMNARHCPTDGYKVRSGWHAVADWYTCRHLSTEGRAWFRVYLRGTVKLELRPYVQGGIWATGSQMMIGKAVL